MPLLNPLPRMRLARAEAPVHWQRFKLDAARWVVPEAITDVEQLTPRLIAALVVPHIPLRSPAIGDRTFFGVGSHVQRGLYIGHKDRGSAAAVVLRHVPADATAVGFSARVLNRKQG